MSPNQEKHAELVRRIREAEAEKAELLTSWAAEAPYKEGDIATDAEGKRFLVDSVRVEDTRWNSAAKPHFYMRGRGLLASGEVGKRELSLAVDCP